MESTKVNNLNLQIVDWIAGSAVDPLEQATLAAFRITAGHQSLPITEVEDSIAHTVRSHIYVSVYSVAQWLLVNWWRLRWEPCPLRPSADWLRAHSMAGIGSDYAWPSLQFASDGEFIHLRLKNETKSDVAAIRYLRDISIRISASEFEKALDRFFDSVVARVTARFPNERELIEIRAEVDAERTNPAVAQMCRLQALAGIDPGAASDEWLNAVAKLTEQAGAIATGEIMATIPNLKGGLTAAQQAVSAMKASSTQVNIKWASLPNSNALPNEISWRRGVRLARNLRLSLGIPPGPVPRKTLEDLLQVKLPLPRTEWSGEKGLQGGFQNGINNGRTALLMMTPREDNQRFLIAKLAGAALISPASEHVLTVSDSFTALQKFERSFAQEFLCPWKDLNDFTDDHGTDEDGIADAAKHFGVSEQLVLTTLVNKKKAPRNRLHAM